MFNRHSAEKPHALDSTIENLISELAGLESSEEYGAAVASLKILMELRIADKAAAKSFTMSPDTIAAVAANLLGIAMILGFEKANVITTKSLSFVPKMKIGS